MCNMLKYGMHRNLMPKSQKVEVNSEELGTRRDEE
jgi:hypothetical protein